MNRKYTSRRTQIIVGLGLGVGLLASCRPHGASTAGEHGLSEKSARAWVIIGPEGVATVRAIAKGKTCPSLEVDGKETLNMDMRYDGHDSNYPVSICEKSLPKTATSAKLDGEIVPVAKPNPTRIVFIGDTGCRIKAGVVQACNDPKAWPFARIAKSAAEWQPDLVVHTGDLIYRKDECPAGNQGCAESPSGMNWATWQADVFAPAAALFRAAPWVVARGNHESCELAGSGFFRFMDPRPLNEKCSNTTEPYSVPIGDVQMWVTDSSNTEDKGTAEDAEKGAEYQKHLMSLSKDNASHIWLLTHRPAYGVHVNRHHKPKEDGTPPEPQTMNAILQAAINASSFTAMDVVFSGHIHVFQTMHFNEEYPAQVIVGNSGTLLDKYIPTKLDGISMAGKPIVEGMTQEQFGFVTVERASESWLMQLRDPDGLVTKTCTIRKRAIRCEK